MTEQVQKRKKQRRKQQADKLYYSKSLFSKIDKTYLLLSEKMFEPHSHWGAAEFTEFIGYGVALCTYFDNITDLTSITDPQNLHVLFRPLDQRTLWIKQTSAAEV